MRKFLLLLPLLLFFAHSAKATITLVQDCPDVLCTSPTSSCTATCPNANFGSAHLIVGWWGPYNTASHAAPSNLTGVTDSAGSTYDYTTLTLTPNNATGNNYQIGMFFTCNSGGSGGKTVTPAYPSWTGDEGVIVHAQEYSGVATSACLEHHLSKSQADVIAMNVSPVATNGPNDLLVTAGVAHDGPGTRQTLWDVNGTTVHSYTADGDSSAWLGSYVDGTEHQVEASSGSWGSFNWGLNGSHGWGLYLLSFENASNVASGFATQIGGFLVGP